MKMMSKSPSRHVVRLQGKLKLKKKYMFLILYNIFPTFQCAGHQPISGADVGRSVNHARPLILSYLQNLCFFNFVLGREGGLQPGNSLSPRPWEHQNI